MAEGGAAARELAPVVEGAADDAELALEALVGGEGEADAAAAVGPQGVDDEERGGEAGGELLAGEEGGLRGGEEEAGAGQPAQLVQRLVGDGGHQLQRRRAVQRQPLQHGLGVQLLPGGGLLLALGRGVLAAQAEEFGGGGVIFFIHFYFNFFFNFFFIIIF